MPDVNMRPADATPMLETQDVARFFDVSRPLIQRVLAREGKLGRSYGCFSVAHADLTALRERMGQGRLLFAWA